MIFETSRLILRPWKIEDAEELYKYAKDPRVGPRAGWPVHTSVENSREIIKTVFSVEGTYAVVLKETELPIGCIGIMRNANLSTAEDEVELGYWLGQPYWGQGVIPEACEALIKYCFETLDCSKIWCAYYRGNHNSCRVMQKCGFEFHHTEYDKYIDLLDEYRTEHVAVLTKERFDKIQQEGLENITSVGEWSVNFEGNFWGGFGWGSKNVPIHQSFQYCGYYSDEKSEYF
ncbi:MAG: GNAT family N-acetyltransferase [Lachnospiraceae bacterium]|nr:GNAT family N-acetyltransferase [Lachnospiraceae bacterium]